MFFTKLEKQAKLKNSLLCVGLDPAVPSSVTDVFSYIVTENKKLIENTLEYTICYKPNIAFYEAYGVEGYKALKATLEFIPDDVCVLLDAKRNDIGNTATAYAKAAFEELKVDAITLNPYMGRTSAEPFLQYDDKAYFQLCRTSNPGADKLQTLTVKENDEPLYITVAKEACSWSSRTGLVVAGNDVEALKAVRKELPNVWMLSPGIGTQGGSMFDAVEAGLRSDGLGILPVVVRAIAQAENQKEAAKEFVSQLNKAREKVLSQNNFTKNEDILKQSVLKGLIDTECFRLGDFTLKSGLKSPFYVDLRRTSSSPQLMKKIGKAYATLLKNLKCDRIAGIPVAAISLATACSLETGIPMIYPRIAKKEHGSGNLIEGNFKPGERVVLLDDLITTGKSKIEAIEILRDAGLIVEDLIVLLERGAQGRKDMEAANINLYSYADIEELFVRCVELNLIDEAKHKELLSFTRQ